MNDSFILESPIGTLTAKVLGDALTSLDLGAPNSAKERAAATQEGRAIRDRLAAYFAGDLAALEAIRAQPTGTPFQVEVWKELQRIGVGCTISYAELARRIGRPSAVRAVAGANGANPVPVVIPCHRVIGADGSLTGYGGGLPRKRWLLAHESAALPLLARSGSRSRSA